MKLSIVIVNYNVEHFLDQCLHSVYRASKNLDTEVFVVDNNSVDDSMKMVRKKYPQTICIENKKNVGFSVANNQAIKESKGEYVLLLNPDTVVEEDTFEKTVSFMDSHPDAGGMGIRMIDGSGNFLPESKRGIPTPWVSFCKMSGLTRLFPKSKLFAHYYMGHLSELETNPVEILAGAFMLLRKETLDKAGLLDESFFMYGEDIDLSYRIIQAGYKNYYFADSQIIHYKGESTKKGSLNYVFIFYKAMVIFAQKHFSKNRAKLFGFFINSAIYVRAFMAMIMRVLNSLLFVILDVGVLYSGLFLIKEYWESNHRFIQGGEYPTEVLTIAFPSYIAIWLISVFMANGYTKPAKPKNLIYGIFLGTVIILALYGLLPEEYRFSRAIILLGAAWALIGLPLYRFILQSIFKTPVFERENKSKRVILIGDKKESDRVLAIMRSTGWNPAFVDIAEPSDISPDLEKLTEKINIFNIDEVIFCSENLSSHFIIENIGKLKNKKVEIKIAPPESAFIIGSNSIHTQGEIYTVNVNQIAKVHQKRNKRIFDLLVSTIMIVMLPVLIFTTSASGLIKNIFEVIIGKKSWVGYALNSSYENLPQIKQGVLSPICHHNESKLSDEMKGQLDFLYARDYHVKSDIQILSKCLRFIANRKE